MTKEFTKGMTVIVVLTKNHELPGDEKSIVEHPATIINVHPNEDWYTVRLDAKHAGGTQILSVPAEVVKKTND